MIKIEVATKELVTMASSPRQQDENQPFVSPLRLNGRQQENTVLRPHGRLSPDDHSLRWQMVGE